MPAPHFLPRKFREVIKLYSFFLTTNKYKFLPKSNFHWNTIPFLWKLKITRIQQIRCKKTPPAQIPSLEVDSGKAFSKRISFSSYAPEVSESGNVKSRVSILTNHGIFVCSVSALLLLLIPRWINYEMFAWLLDHQQGRACKVVF